MCDNNTIIKGKQTGQTQLEVLELSAKAACRLETSLGREQKETGRKAKEQKETRRKHKYITDVINKIASVLQD